MDELRDLVRRAREGDEVAFDEIVRRRKEKAVYLAYQIVGDWEDARDVAQGAFVKIWQQLSAYDERYSFDTWFRRIVTNQAIDAYRRGRVRRDTLAQEHEQKPAPPAGTALHSITRDEVQRLFDEAAALLPPRERAVFVLREMEDMSPQEIAQTLGITESTVRNHLFKARQVLKEYIQEHYPEYAPRRGMGA